MANDETLHYNWYRRYKVRAADMNGLEKALLESTRGLSEGLVGAAVLSGFEVSSVSGLSVVITPGISTAATGYLGVVSTESTVSVPASALGSLPSRSLVVIRPAPTPSNFIASPTVPFAQVPLNETQLSQVMLIQGAASGTPDYPTKGENDVIILGLMIPPGASSLDASMLDFEVRETVGTNSQIQKNLVHLDDRLRPYRSGPRLLGIKSSQTSGSSARLFSYPSGSTPSLYPLSGGLHNDLDSFIDFSTGVISGGDTTSPAFSPVVPSGNLSIICTITLTATDTISTAYGIPGTLQQCLTAIRQQKTTGAGAVPNTGGLYPIAYAIVTALGGVYSDVQIIDARPLGGGGGGGGGAPIFFNELIGVGDNSTTTFPLPKKPKDAASVLIRFDGLGISSGYTVNPTAPSVTFSTPVPRGISVSAYGVAAGPSSVSGYSGALVGTVNSSNRTFAIAVNPVDQNSSLVMLDGDFLDNSEWALVQSSGGSYVFFNTAPDTGQVPSIFCLINVIATGSPAAPAGAYVAVGSRAAPTVIDPVVGILPTADPLQHWYVAGQAGMGAQIVTATPPIAPGLVVGKVIKITIVDPTDFPVFSDLAGGISQNGDWPATGGPVDAAAITYSWDGIQFSEDSRR